MTELVRGSFPTEVRFTKIDLHNAAGLAVMPVDIEGTKAGENVQNRLCIIGQDGKSTLAAFTFEEDGAADNAFWQEIRPQLALVPHQMIQLAPNYLYLACNCPVAMSAQDAFNEEEYAAAINLIASLEGGYILRLSDGVLFRSDFQDLYCIEQASRRPDYLFSNLVQTGTDGRSFVLGNGEEHTLLLSGGPEISEIYGFILFEDQGNVLETRTPSSASDLLKHISWFLVTKDKHIVLLPANGAQAGLWSFDWQMNPTFLDLDSDLSSILFAQYQYNHEKNCMFFPVGNEGYFARYEPGADSEAESAFALYKLTLSGSSAGCQLIARTATELFYPSWDVYSLPNGVLYQLGYYNAIFDARKGSVTIVDVPDDLQHRNYNQAGIAYQLSDDLDHIDRYDIFNLTSKQTPVNWNATSTGKPVSATVSQHDSVFEISGLTRNATSFKAFIDCETGTVTVSDAQQYEGSIVSSYVRLN